MNLGQVRALEEQGRPLIVFAGSASEELTRMICQTLGIPMGQIDIRRFSDGEIRVKINESVRGANCFVVQSCYTPVNEHLMELLLILDALKRASAAQVNAIIPYYGYARQDRKDEGRVALSARLVANLLTAAGATRVVAVDLHSAQIQGFFDIPVDHLYAAPVLVDYIKRRGFANFVVVSPDVGNVKRARAYANRLDAPLAIIDKRRPEPNVAEVMNIIGDVSGKDVFLFDDIIDTAGTLVGAAEALKKRGVGKIYACCTHPVLSGPAKERLAASCIEEIIVTDTIPQRDSLAKLTVVSLAPMLAEAIKRIHSNESVSTLFR
ncbi:MAG: ribose-phosphate pyrophosphokinase [Candidatus Sumerlaeaceae bacterium]|nr:ribose-phosphate pyrophosphokinase [Candidatus Sumerlaeaceae bacterium]